MIIRSKAPLRLGLAGGGTDVSPYSDDFGGAVLNATLNLYSYCSIEKNQSKTIVFNMSDRGIIKKFPLASKLPYDGEFDLLIGVYNRICKDYNNNAPLSISVTTQSDAPGGSGLGTSSTMVVAILTAYVELLKIPLGEYDIAQLAFDIERNDIGLKGGKQDQYAAAFGGFNFMEFHSDNKVIINPLRVKNWIIDELQESMILYYTGTSRDSGTIINEQIKSAINKEARSLQALHELKAMAIKMKEALLKGEINEIANLLKKSWLEKKKTSNVVTNSLIDDVYNVAIKAGAVAGKVSGAGGGGFMMLLVDPNKKQDVIRALKQFGGRIEKFSFSKYGATSWSVEKNKTCIKDGE